MASVVPSLLLFSSSLSAGTCSMCREALRSGGSSGLITGFYWSIVLVLGVSTVIIGFAIRYVCRRY